MLRQGQLDIGTSSAPVEDELSDLSKGELSKFVNHVIGTDAQPIVVSKAIYDAGVTKLTLDQVRAIYLGHIKNWSAVGGPDREMQVIGSDVGTGTDTAFRSSVFGNPDAPTPGVLVRKTEQQQVQQLVSQSDNAIAYLSLAFVDMNTTPAVALQVDGTTYEYGKNLSSPKYPLARDLSCYTYNGTSAKAAAFINMLLSDYGQQQFVGSAGYLPLSTQRLNEQRNALPQQSSTSK